MKGGRILLAGFSSPLGHELLLLLEGSEMPVGRLWLFDPPPAGNLTQFRGEPQLVAPLPSGQDHAPDEVPDETDRADLLLLCGEPEAMAALQRRASREGPPAVSLTPPGPDAPDAPAVLLHGWKEDPPAVWPSLLYAPTPSACVATRLLRALDPLGPLEAVHVTTFRSAADVEREGPQALFDQSMALVNMEELPDEIFTERRAFEVLPRGRDAWLEAQLAQTLDLDAGALFSVRLDVPVFHGSALSLVVELPEPADPERTADLLAAADLEPVPAEEATPAATAAAGSLRVAPPQAHGRRLWLWAAYEAEASGALENALALARVHLEGVLP